VDIVGLARLLISPWAIKRPRYRRRWAVLRRPSLLCHARFGLHVSAGLRTTQATVGYRHIRVSDSFFSAFFTYFSTIPAVFLL
jgi:hypothetical protein